MALSTRNLSEEARKAIQELTRPGLYTVLRQGRSSAPYRILFASGAEQTARESYDRTARMLRQGAVLLLGPTGELLGCESGPMVRSRW
jgi:RecB family exonuclease